jgi:hypothetical protein
MEDVFVALVASLVLAFVVAGPKARRATQGDPPASKVKPAGK